MAWVKGTMRYRSNYRGRYAARSARFRNFRARRRRMYRRRRARAGRWKRRRRPRPTLRRLASGVRTLFKRSKLDNKFFYLLEDNTLVENNSDWTIIGGKALNSCPAYTAGGDPLKMREQDSESAIVKSIRIRLQITANDVECEGLEPYYVMLIKTSHQRGTIAGIQPCQPNEFFDYDSVPPGIPVFWGFRLVADNGQEILADTKVLKVWTGQIMPSGAYRAITTDYSALALQANVPAVGQINDFVPYSGAPPGASAYTITQPGSVQYVPTLPKERNFKHTHKCGKHGMMTKFEDVAEETPIVNSYFLLALGSNTVGSRNGYRISSSVKVNFVSS